MFWDNSIAEVDIRTGEISRVASGESGQLSSDGRMFAFTRNTKPEDDDQSNQDVWVATLNGGEPRPLTPLRTRFITRLPPGSSQVVPGESTRQLPTGLPEHGQR